MLKTLHKFDYVRNIPILFTSGINIFKWRPIYVYDLSSWFAFISEINCDIYEIHTKTERNTFDIWDTVSVREVRVGVQETEHRASSRDNETIRQRTRQNATFPNLFYFMILHFTTCCVPVTVPVPVPVPVPSPTLRPRPKLLTLCFINKASWLPPVVWPS